jgi:hypothetical protein
VSRLTPYARRLRDRRRKRDRAWRETVAWLAAHPGPSSAEVFSEYGRLRQEQAAIREEIYRASWEQVFQRMETATW